MFGARENDGGDPIQNISYGGNISLDEVRIYKKALTDGDVLDVVGAVLASPVSLSLITPSANDHFITIVVPPSVVATSAVSVVVTSDKPGWPSRRAQWPVSSRSRCRWAERTPPAFAVQANGAGTAHFTYTCALLPVAAADDDCRATTQHRRPGGLLELSTARRWRKPPGSSRPARTTAWPVGSVAYVPGG